MTPGVERRAALAVAATVARVAERLRAVPRVRVSEGDDGVIVEGRGLRRRAAEEPTLRWPGAAS